jgi:hypothetical protein
VIREIKKIKSIKNIKSVKNIKRYKTGYTAANYWSALFRCDRDDRTASCGRLTVDALVSTYFVLLNIVVIVVFTVPFRKYVKTHNGMHTLKVLRRSGFNILL